MLASCGLAPTATPQSNEVTPVFAFSEAIVGRNRIAIGLVRGGTPLNDPGAKVHLRFFNLDENNPQPKAETDATDYSQGLPAGFYVAYLIFDRLGNWGVEVETRLSGQAQPSTSKPRVEVKEHSSKRRSEGQQRTVDETSWSRCGPVASPSVAFARPVWPFTHMSARQAAVQV